MREFIEKYQKAIVGTGAVAVLLICYLQQKELSKLRNQSKISVSNKSDIQMAHTIDSVSTISDSLKNELFVKGIELGRYEVALELLKEQDKKAADKFELILTTQTE